MLTRFRCYLFGCCDDVMCTCQRCGTNLYEDQGKFYQRPCWLVGRLQRARYIAKNCLELIIGKKCEVCGKRYWSNYVDWTCSEECFKKWIPF